MKKISVIGTGFIAKGFVNALQHHPAYKIEKILTRTSIDIRSDFPSSENMTNNIDDLIENSDLIVECSGDAIYACDSIDKILKAKIPVVTMNSEFHVTVGSYFIGKGLVTEAEGDQPGVLAQLHEEAIAMGFKPLVYGNIKGFLNHSPTLEDMTYWGNKSGISLDMVTSFTDGTKVQIEQTLAANGFGTTIVQDGLVGLKNDSAEEGGSILAKKAKDLDTPISDYLLSPTLPAGVFLTVEHHESQAESLRYYKMGEGPFYTLVKPYHLCHLEMFKTIDRVFKGGGVLLDNSTSPTISTATIAKKNLVIGEKIEKGIGSFEVRGIAVKIKEHRNHVPIGLMKDVVLKRNVQEGSVVTFDDIEIPDSLALTAWKSIEKSVLKD
ncbi:MAG TPA: NAD(P)-dependent oxidoreductase [Sulfurovum sp.]|nr:NAD(P)-dependent oxidoreductase [Sulfurovum sp.]